MLCQHPIQSLYRGVVKSQMMPLQKELKRVPEEWLEREFERAAQDSSFLKGLQETMMAYEELDAETARMIVDA